MKLPILPSYYKRQKAGIQLFAYDGSFGRTFGFYTPSDKTAVVIRHDGFKTKRERDIAVLDFVARK